MVKIHTHKNVADLLTKAFNNGIGVNVDDSKLILLSINLLLLGKVNAVRHKLTTAVEIDGKKIIVTEVFVRSDLQLDDEEGMDCLPNATIFEELTRMGSRKPKRKDTEVPQPSGPTTNVADEAVNEEMDGSLVRAATTASSLEAE
ncbi:hypothetical protein Tco_1460541 [Tanacetum coccineum]